MSDEIEKFDANEAMQRVRERIKDSFVSLIPDEQWNEMVKKEVDSYFKEKESGYGQRAYASNFTLDVHSVLSEEVKQRVGKYLLENFNTAWNSNGIPICNAKVEDFITQNAGKILADMIGGTVQMAISQAGYNLR